MKKELSAVSKAAWHLEKGKGTTLTEVKLKEVSAFFTSRCKNEAAQYGNK
jgi:hypothetical protein